jgi:hypothetical protein
MGDIIDEEMERELAQLGKSIFASTPIPTDNRFPAKELSEDDLAILRAFAFKTEEHLTNTAFAKLPYTFPDANIHTLKVTKARIQFLSEFKPVAYDCCPNSCCCYVGQHAAEKQCPYCKEPRFDTDVSVIKKYFNLLEVEQWGKVERLEGGDRMLASSMLASLEDRCDATYVRVSDNESYLFFFGRSFTSSTLFWSIKMHVTPDVSLVSNPKISLVSCSTFLLSSFRRQMTSI